MRLVFRFVADLVLRHIKSQSLPRRLWGWEQASRLIDLGRRHRWYFRAYLVRGWVQQQRQVLLACLLLVFSFLARDRPV